VLRVASAGALAALCAGIVVVADRVVSAQPQPATTIKQPGKKDDKKDDKKDKDKDIRPAEDFDLPFAPPYERDATMQLRGARDYLAFKSPPWNTICPLLQNILDAKSDSFFNILDKAGGTVLTRRISVKTEANRIIAAFPKDGLEFYQQSYGQTAAAQLADAVKTNYDLGLLSEVSQRYFHTKAGADATALLGDLYLQRGNYLEAAYAFERLLARPNADDLLSPHTLFKAALALKRSGDPRHASLAQGATDRLQKAAGRNGLVIGRRTFSFEQLKAEIDRPVTALRATATVGEWTGRYGNAQRNGLVVGGPPFLMPAFDPAPMVVNRKPEDGDANGWISEELSRLFDRENKNNKTFPLPAFFPVTTSDLVVYRTYDGVCAVATHDHTTVLQGEPKLVRAGDMRWLSRSRFGVHQLMTPGNTNYDEPKIREDVTNWWNALYKPQGLTSVLYENPLLGSLAHDGQSVYYVDDVGLPPPVMQNNPEFGGPFPNQARYTGELRDAVLAGQLIATDLRTGNRVWTLGRVDGSRATPATSLPRLNEEEADKTTNAFQLCLRAIFLGPPLPLNGRLYVLIEHDGVIRLLCLDPKNLVPVKDYPQKVPALLWSQKLGRPNTALPGDTVRRFQGAFLAAGEGILVCPTNSGLVIGVDIMSRSLLWAHAYRKLDSTAMNKQPGFNPNVVQQVQLPAERWRAAAPIVVGARVLITAYDSNSLECLDVRTGKVLWSTPRQTGDLYVGGVADDRVVVVGQNKVRAYHLTEIDPNSPQNTVPAPKLLWEFNLPSAVPTGHGVVAKTAFYLPVRSDNAGKDAVPAGEIWAINLQTGAVASKTAARKRNDSTGTDLPRYGLGNLVFQDGLVVAQSPWEVAVYPQLEQKRAEMDRKLKANPKDPAGLTDRGELLLDEGKVSEAIADFKEAQRNSPDEAVRWRVREKLYVAYTELLRDRFDDSEGYLKEYETLCTVPVEDDMEPFEKKRREDETLRRKRLYYYLLAKGREDQKKLGEAFDHYLTLAGLGEGKTLFEMPDEPNVRMRPDVWARGRIEGMIRKTGDPAARKSLEDRVSKEWEAVRAANDLKKLREFVDVFGPYFPAGAAAELQLADRLLATNDEDDARDAQVHLANLRVSAEDKTVRAKATETLARLLVKNQLMEDAVALYLQLGKEFPDVVVRDGKTGADFLTDLLTDRRLLPYLEPARVPLPPKVKAEQREGQHNGQMGASFEFEPEGDLFPMYRRLRFVIDMVNSGNGTWTVRAFDRATGLERCHFHNVNPPMQYNPGNIQHAKSVLASGHLLLAQVGHWVYCFDLAEGKERWRKNLLGEGVNPPANGINEGADGEVTINYQDGTRLTIGHSLIIQPGYVGILTRDGLEVFEPTTKRQLWTRRNVEEKTRISGDARYILLTETGADRRPVTCRLLRAVDGMQVEGVPDAAKAMKDAKSYQVYGRHVLLTEAPPDKPQVLRLYDAATGKDVWKTEYDPKAIPLRSHNPEWVGYVLPTGEIDVIAAQTGQVVGKLQIDKKMLDEHLKGCVEAQLFADPDRFFVVLDKTAGGAGGLNRQRIYGYTVRTTPVNGPMYAFDRATGRRLWFVDELFDNQWLVTERFADLPVVIAACLFHEKNGNQSYRVVVVEKASGAVRFNRGVTNNGNYFQHLTVDPKNSTIDLHRFDLRITIKPDEAVAGK
jgi:outer membrane protein assembly factor BamB/tetratricopeptide (TPR) repeat protein